MLVEKRDTKKEMIENRIQKREKRKYEEQLLLQQSNDDENNGHPKKNKGYIVM